MNDAGDPHYFVSFSYNDDLPPTDHNRGWVTYFREQLQRDFAQETGLKYPSGFTDAFSKDSSVGEIDSWIEDEIAKSDFLIALISPSVRKSQYCTSERSLFRDMCRRKRVNPADRTFVVCLDRELPDDLRGIRGMHPFYKDLSGGRTQRYAHPIPKADNSTEYDRAVLKLASEMARESREVFPKLKSHPARARRPSLPRFGRASSRRIYVEGVAPQDSDFVRETAAKLRVKGFDDTWYSEVHDKLNGSRPPDPMVEFKNNVDASDIVVVVRQNGTKDYAKKRYADAIQRFSRRPEKDRRNIMLIDTAPQSALPDDENKRWYSLPKAKPEQCATRIAIELARAEKLLQP